MKLKIFLVLILAIFLRIWQLDKVPVSLFGDEVDVGYHAYSLLKTGKDYSGNFLPIHLRSLAEWRAPLYIYSAIPTVGLFGISPLGVRLPAAIFGILGVALLYLLTKEITSNRSVSLLSAFFLAISPWHLQYSRAGFEVTQMLFLYIAGIYCFLKGLKDGRWFYLSAICLGLTPWSYSTAKLFLPLTIVAILLIWGKELINTSKKYLFKSFIIFSIITLPFAINTLFGGGTQRIEGISIFNDPTIIPQIGFERLDDIQTRDKEAIDNTKVNVFDKLFHNQPLSFSAIFINNYLQSFSTEFLFIKGDNSPRHSIGTGEFYKIQAPFLLIGLIFFLITSIKKKDKIFLVFWLVASPIASALTQNGGVHATRLILILPPLIILVSLGVYYAYNASGQKTKVLFKTACTLLLFINFILYMHTYWVHYPQDSEKWWHAGFREAIQSTVREGQKYDKLIISGADEPPLIFFLGWSQYPPSDFQKKYPLVKENIEGFGEVSKLDKYYFTPIGTSKGLYELGSILDQKTLYLATAKEINLNLIKEPGRIPSDLKLIQSITYPSGDPAFYLFTRNGVDKK